MGHGAQRQITVRRSVLAFLVALLALTTLASCRPPPLPDGVVALSVGDQSACALTSTGGVQCWTSGLTSAPGLSSGIKAVTNGYRHACVLTDAGGVKCWGDNYRGQLGDGSQTSSDVPVDVVGLSSGVVAVEAGVQSSCALLATGDVRCWGLGAQGQLGNGSQGTISYVPTDVIGLATNVTTLSAGTRYMCAVTSAGAVQCWGNHPDPTTGVKQVATQPRDLTGLPTVTGLSAGDAHVCAITSTKAVVCWGENGFGQLGTGTLDEFRGASAVVGLPSGALSIALGGTHSCTTVSNGSAHCWGNTENGRTGVAAVGPSLTPVAVASASSGVRALAAYGDNTCALINGGTVRCWSAGVTRGTGSTALPQSIVGLPTGAAAIDAGYKHTCAVKSGGTVACWGETDQGRLGIGTAAVPLGPAEVAGLTNATAVAAGFAHTCALTTAGAVVCWGANDHGQLGDGSGTTALSPVAVTGIASGATSITTGWNHSCATLDTGAIKCWGANEAGQLGDGTTISSATPVDVAGIAAGSVSVAGGRAHTCALTTEATLACWGDNGYGQLGIGTVVDALVPTEVAGLSGVALVAAGDEHTCAATTSGAMSCWGLGGPTTTGPFGPPGGYGRLGNDPSAPTIVPDGVAGLDAGVTSISAGWRQTCAVVSGAAKCWGNGSLGSGGPNIALQPVDVVNLPGDEQMISTGNRHTCAVSTTGAVHCWGDNTRHQVGVGIKDVLGGASYYNERAPAP